MTSISQPKQSGGEQQLFSQMNFPEIYEKELVAPLFQSWVNSLLEDVELKPGNHLLDVACGTGIVARVAKERIGNTGKIVGIDINPGMLAVAKQIASDIDWREGDICNLSLNDEQFDVLTCQQGFQFFPDKSAAAQNMHHSLKKNGRLGISTWRPDEEFPLLYQLRKIAEQHLGPIDDRRHSLGKPDPIEEVLSDAGFHDIKSKQLKGTIRFTDGISFLHLNTMALFSMSNKSGNLDEVDRKHLVESIIRDSSELIQKNTNHSGFTYDIGTNVVLAKA